MKELEKFFNLSWSADKPKIFLVKDRRAINKLLGEKTPAWLVGWIDNSNIFILDKKNYEKESSHRYFAKEYSKLIKHELVHVFFLKISGSKSEPDWLWEGLALYLSGQIKSENKPKQFKEFLKFHSTHNKRPQVYKEAGFAVEFLIENYGRKKLLKLIKSLKNIDTKKQFEKKFKQIYGFEPNYKNFNQK
jgi:hypothetical protein